MGVRSVRLHHPTLRNCVFTLEQQSRIYPTPYPCPRCNKTHIFKTYHLNLNEHGDVCISEQIYQMFKDEGVLEELTATREVTPAPTTLTMGFIDQKGAVGVSEPNPFVVISREKGPVNIP